MQHSDAPREAPLLRRARKARGRSPERIVEELTRIKMSGRNWRQIEDGRHAPDDTLAHMAFAVGLSAEQLVEVGRGEAAEILREIERQHDIEQRMQRQAFEARGHDPERLLEECKAHLEESKALLEEGKALLEERIEKSESLITRVQRMLSRVNTGRSPGGVNEAR